MVMLILRGLLAVVCLSVIMRATDGARVLVYPFGQCLNSHLLNAEKLSELLLAQGHQVSMVVSSAYHSFDHRQQKHCVAMVTDNHTDSHCLQPDLIQFPAPVDYKPVCHYDNMDFMLFSPIKQRFQALTTTFVDYCDILLSNSALLQRLKDSRFDLLILEPLDPCGRVLADYLDIPFIPLMTNGLGHWDGNPRPPSYLPAAIAPFTTDMSFPQRLGNFLMKCLYDTIPVLMGFDQHFNQMKNRYGLNTSLSIADTFKRASIKLVNSDFAVEYPAPIEPNTIMIGGFAVSKPKPLSDELEAFMESAGPDGVIVMAFGTITKRFEASWTKLFTDALSKLPQKVLWRYTPEGQEELPGNLTLSKNIKVLPWLPQGDLLAHPKTRLFITHCGLNSMFEATYHGVPIVGLPLSGDMMNHATKMTDHLRMGVQLDVFSLTSQKLYSAIQTVLADSRFQENAKAVSRRFRDQPISAAEKITFWVDYVIRHNGAPHLKSPAANMTWYQYFSVDVIAFLLGIVSAVLLGSIWLVYVLSCRVLRWLLRTLISVYDNIRFGPLPLANFVTLIVPRTENGNKSETVVALDDSKKTC